MYLDVTVIIFIKCGYEYTYCVCWVYSWILIFCLGIAVASAE